MDCGLFTSWSDYRNAVSRVLALAEQELLVLDTDLEHLALENAEHNAYLTRFLTNPQARLRLLLHNAAPLRSRCPHLMSLFRLHSQRMEVCELPPHLQNVRDCLLIADGRHAAIRFEYEQARGKLYCDDTVVVSPYQQRFEAIWQEGGTPIGATTLGL